jgi:hypothetical protein
MIAFSTELLKLKTMKRNNVKMPEFDEIIFENRNKAYGAYVLRKGYKSVASLSVLFGTIIFALLVLLLTLNPEETVASAGPRGGVIILTDPVQPDSGLRKHRRFLRPFRTLLKICSR